MLLLAAGSHGNNVLISRIVFDTEKEGRTEESATERQKSGRKRRRDT